MTEFDKTGYERNWIAAIRYDRDLFVKKKL